MLTLVIVILTEIYYHIIVTNFSIHVEFKNENKNNEFENILNIFYE